MPGRFVLDNSVVMSWFFKDESNRYAQDVFDGLLTDEAIVPTVWPLEFGNALLIAERKKRLTEPDTVRFLSLIKTFPIVVDHDTHDQTLNEVVLLARTHRLTTYDASYLDLAMRLELPIATLDADLAKAAKKCEVPAYRPAGLHGNS